jgi:NAD(P)-dependent dehydrogenase (short-subunit alcohol dehydrogenase family)
VSSALSHITPRETTTWNSDFGGKRVLITGGSEGVGSACAQAFLAEGATVAITSRAQANLDAAVK